MSNQNYTRTHHNKILSRIQAVLDKLLEIIHANDLSSDYVISGSASGHLLLEITHDVIANTIGWVELYTGNSYIRIQYSLRDSKVSDSTKWKSDTQPIYGHIQVAYSHEFSDPDFNLDFLYLLSCVEAFIKQPRSSRKLKSESEYS